MSIYFYSGFTMLNDSENHRFYGVIDTCIENENDFLILLQGIKKTIINEGIDFDDFVLTSFNKIRNRPWAKNEKTGEEFRTIVSQLLEKWKQKSADFSKNAEHSRELNDTDYGRNDGLDGCISELEDALKK